VRLLTAFRSISRAHLDDVRDADPARPGAVAGTDDERGFVLRHAFIDGYLTKTK